MKQFHLATLLFVVGISIVPAWTQVPNFPAIPSQGSGNKADQYLLSGAQLYFQQDYDLAIQALNEALKLNPKLTPALLQRGLAYMAKGDKESAVKDYRAVIKIDPRGADAAKAHFYQLQILQEKGDLDGALAEIEKVRKIMPNQVEVYLTRGRLRKAKGNLDGALADFDKAISLAPRNAAAFDGRGQVRKSKGDLDGAIDDFTKALEMNIRQASYMVHRSEARMAKGDIDGALADCNHALVPGWDPNYAPGYVLRGILKLAKGQDAEAQADFDNAISIDPALAKAVDEAKAKSRKSPEIKK
jgi:tetratricopeptide (TPR) repeat protein